MPLRSMSEAELLLLLFFFLLALADLLSGALSAARVEAACLSVTCPVTTEAGALALAASSRAEEKSDVAGVVIGVA